MCASPPSTPLPLLPAPPPTPSPLSAAVLGGSQPVVELLVEAGAAGPSSGGGTAGSSAGAFQPKHALRAMAMAAQRGQLAAVRLLYPRLVAAVQGARRSLAAGCRRDLAWPLSVLLRFPTLPTFAQLLVPIFSPPACSPLCLFIPRRWLPSAAWSPAPAHHPAPPGGGGAGRARRGGGLAARAGRPRVALWQHPGGRRAPDGPHAGRRCTADQGWHERRLGAPMCTMRLPGSSCRPPQ